MILFKKKMKKDFFRKYRFSKVVFEDLFDIVGSSSVGFSPPPVFPCSFLCTRALLATFSLTVYLSACHLSFILCRLRSVTPTAFTSSLIL